MDTIENAKLLFKNLKIRNFEIIVINDGSTDKTLEYTKKTGVKVINILKTWDMVFLSKKWN